MRKSFQQPVDNKITCRQYKRGIAVIIVYFKTLNTMTSSPNSTPTIKLFPLKDGEYDLVLYKLVNMLTKHPEFEDFLKAIGMEEPDVRSVKTRNFFIDWENPYLVFPAEDVNNREKYSDYELKQPYIVAGYGQEMISYGEGGCEEEDWCALRKVYYVQDSSITDHVALREHLDENKEYGMYKPDCKNNTYALKSAINSLQNYLAGKSVDVGQWRERLQMSKAMLEAEADKLQILQNAGLYDIAFLWRLLPDDDDVKDLRLKMESQLHRYAMMVVNTVEKKEETIEPVAPARETPRPSIFEPRFPTGGKKASRTSYVPNDYREWYDIAAPDRTGGYDWDNVYPKYPFRQKNTEAPSYVDQILPGRWWNDVTLMEQTFNWTNNEKKLLARAREHGGEKEYAKVLENLVRQRLRQLAKKEYDAERRAWLWHNSR